MEGAGSYLYHSAQHDMEVAHLVAFREEGEAMSGICDICKRSECSERQDGAWNCDKYLSYASKDTRYKSNYTVLFGTPERAARTLSEHDTSCRDCLLGAYCGEECLTEEEPKLLKWLEQEADA